MTAVEYDGAILVVDAGLMFPENDMLGVDIVIPDISYLLERREMVRGIIITHGHEDHIGALPYVLPRINPPIYATPLTRGLIEVKLKSHKLLKDAQLCTFQMGDTLDLTPFQVQTFHVSHSIPDGVGLAITTPVGTVVHSGDFKFDPSPVDGQLTDFARLAQVGSRGVLALMSDSTNADSPGHTPSEETITTSFVRVFALAEGRVIIATFASNISRIQQVIDTAVRFNRKVAIVGRSMQDNAKMAMELGYLRAPEGVLIRVDQLHQYASNEIVIVCTGGQGEPTSALVRMANHDHRQVSLVRGDTVIVSATAIPGNEELVNRTLNNLFRAGATVYYDQLMDVHVSGHASREEQKLLINLLRPKYFIPIHGEYRHLELHARLAQSLGIPEDHIFVVENGAMIEFDEHGNGRVAKETAPASDVLVDGLGVGDVGTTVLRDRQHLSQDGFLVALVTLDTHTGEVVFGPEIITHGFVYTEAAEDLIEGTKEAILETIKKGGQGPALSSKLKDVLSHYLYQQTRRRPMVIPVVTEV
ncbi:MAG: ribonuclease J [Chloroflexi bacterium]|nr:ribonuclease J [Chloroflexota bacterium]MCL5951830.1 ribonuclease J [Chloroflexota bacterium]